MSDSRKHERHAVREVRRGSRTAPTVHSKLGLTLIELLLATVLATLLMMALLGLSRVVAREQASLQQDRTDSPAARQLAELIRDDVMTSRYFDERRGLRLHGHGAKTFSDRQPLLQTAEISYDIVRVGKHSCLLRRERHLDQLPPRQRTDIVWSNAAELEVTSLIDVDDESPGEDAPAGMRAVPSHLMIVLRDESGRILVREEILHHAEFP